MSRERGARLTALSATAAAEAEVIRRIRALFKQAVPEKALLQINERIEEVWRLLQNEINRRGILVELDLAQQLPIVLRFSRCW
jgi:hypothetical protein